MPKIYEYLGILIFFYSNEHEPIHVHGKYGSYESKAEFLIIDGVVVEIKIKRVKNRKPLSASKIKEFKKFLKKYSNMVVKKWVDYFVYHKDLEFERINTKIK